MTLDLPSSKDQQWVKNIVSLVNKGAQKQAKKNKQERAKKEKKKEKERKEMDSDKEALHDGVVSVSVNDTRTLADRLHEKLESLKGERGGVAGKKRKAEDEDMKFVTIEKLNVKKKKKDTNNKDDTTKENGKGDKKQKKDKSDKPDNNNDNNKNDRNGKKTKQAPIYDEDGIEYPGDFYGSDDDIDESLLSDTEAPPPKKKLKKMKNKGSLLDTSPEEEETLRFSTFDFSSGKPVPMYLSNKSPKKKNLPKLLKKAEKLQKELQDMSDKGKEKAEKYKWDRIMKKAQGEKVKDNPILISRKMAAIKKKKKQSAIKWKARNDQVEKDKDIRMSKRNANIKAKMDRKKMAALRRTVGASKLKTPPKRRDGGGAGGKKGGRRPGFEGKKGGFINK